MLNPFMKKITTDTSSEEIARVKSILTENNIKFIINTIRSRGSIGSGFDANAYARSNLSLYNQGVQPTFIYTIYVKRKDFDQAWKLLYRS